MKLSLHNIVLQPVNLLLMYVQVNSKAGRLGNLSDEYDVLEEIGRGTYSVCKRCIHRNLLKKNLYTFSTFVLMHVCVHRKILKTAV